MHAALESDLIEELEVLLDDAVRRQLVADVPVGVLLSGGVDSSVITAMAVRAHRRSRPSPSVSRGTARSTKASTRG